MHHNRPNASADTFSDTSDPRRWLPSSIEKTTAAPGELDFIGGFVSTGALELEAFLTPIVRSLETVRGHPRCTAMKRLDGTSKVRHFKLSQIQHVVPGGIHRLSGPSLPFRIRYDIERYDFRKSTECRLRLNFTDDQSACMPFSDLRCQRPELADLIDSWCLCPDSVSFYFLDDTDCTVIIPTGSILQACYNPLALDRVLKEYSVARRLSSDTCVFNGFSFGEPGRRHYPIRASRNLERAEHEAAQIMPRAVTYYKINGTFLPLLLRPPVCGQTGIRGNAVSRQIDGRSLIFFTNAIEFYSSIDEAVLEAKHDRQRDLDFAPHLHRSFGLANAGGFEFPQPRSRFRKEEMFDTHLFKRLEQRVAQELNLEYGLRPPVVEAIDFRNWCAKTLTRDSVVPPERWWNHGPLTEDCSSA